MTALWNLPSSVIVKKIHVSYATCALEFMFLSTAENMKQWLILIQSKVDTWQDEEAQTNYSMYAHTNKKLKKKAKTMSNVKLQAVTTYSNKK